MDNTIALPRPSSLPFPVHPLPYFILWIVSLPAPIGTTSNDQHSDHLLSVHNLMSVCIPTPTLTLFATATSTTIITTSTVTVQTQPDGSVSSLTLPLIITSIITVVDPTSTLYASCTSTPISTITDSQSTHPQPSPTPTIVVVTTTPAPTVVTEVLSSTLANGVVNVYTITTTSTPPPTIVITSSLINASQSQTSKSSSNIGPIAGGAAGGFILLIGFVAMTWYLLKKCRKPQAVREEEEAVFPYPVTRDRDQNRRLDLTKESRPYSFGHVGRPTSVPGSSPSPSHDGRPDSATPLIGAGLTPMASASGNIATIHSALGEFGPPSHNSTLPLGAAPPDRYSHSAGSVSGASSNAAAPASRPLQVTNSPIPPLSGSSSGAVQGSAPLAAHESAWSEKNPDRGPSLSNDGQFQSPDGRPSTSGPGGVLDGTPSARPGPITGEPVDAPPAYVA